MRSILVVSALALSLGACATPRENRVLTGAAIGGAAGAVALPERAARERSWAGLAAPAGP